MPNPRTRRVSAAIVTLAGVFLVSTAGAELPGENADWTLQKEADDIRIYTIEHPDSRFRAFKAVALLDAPIANVMAVMINPESCLEWVHGCSDSYAFGEGDFFDRYAYSVNDMPWPVSDRDYVIRIRTQGSEETGEIVMNLNATPDRQEEKAGLVRVDRSDTLYRFIPEGDQTHMVWVQHTDPNGALPGWLVNSLVVDIPLNSMEKLEEVANRPRYQNHELVFDDSGQLVAVEAEAQTGDDEKEGNR
ncbi:START domain-containing protein [Marinobacter sp.]|uniref:START domain-containing protein n=1 Tax=Marinobacter sp. TaxID=50741 RepID=UPI00384B3D10